MARRGADGPARARRCRPRDEDAVNIWEAVLLGVVQGLTEFLPVSSSGHLVVGQALLGIEIPGVEFEVAAHFATLVSVLVAYRRRVGALMRGSVRLDPGTWRHLGLIALANVPAAAVFFLLGDVVEAAFESPAAAGVAFLVTGGLLWSARAAMRRGTPRGEPARHAGAEMRIRDEGEPNGGRRGGRGERAHPQASDGWRPDEHFDLPDPPPETPASFSGARGLGVALLIGVAQAFALLPGISRSGSTVVAALWLGVESEDAAEFSFLISVPAILGAVFLQLVNAGAAATTRVPGGPVEQGLGAAPLVFGAVAAAVTGLLAIRIFLAVLRARSFHRFAPYPWLLGLLFLGYLWIA